jgi:hypothetical protein
LRTKKDRKSREERSAQWTSSKTSTSGWASASRPRSASSSSNTRPCEGGVSAALGSVELGEERGEPHGAGAELVGAQAAQRADDRAEGQLAVAEVDAVAGEHARPLRPGAVGELGDQPRLADARLARDEHDGGAPARGALQRGAEAGELALAPDEVRTRDPLGQLARPPTARVYGRPDRPQEVRDLIGRR